MTQDNAGGTVTAASHDPGTQGNGAIERPPRRVPAPVRMVLVAVVSLALGVGLTAGIAALRGSTTTPDGDAATATELPIGEPAAVDVPGTAEPGEPADSAEVAITAFLDAELAGDYADSYLLLSAADREEYRTPGGWVATHADVLPPVTDFTIEEIEQTADRASVVTLIGFESSLDQVVGLVPERARATWLVVAEDGGWSVALAESSFEPLYPPDSEAAAAVQAWARAHQACRPGGEHSPVLGLPALALQLCDTDGAVRVGDVEPFAEGFDTNSFLAAYGEPVLQWARVVPVSSPVALRAVVAPIGQEWTVIGVLASGTPR